MVMRFGSKNGYLLHQNTTLQVLNWRTTFDFLLVGNSIAKHIKKLSCTALGSPYGHALPTILCPFGLKATLAGSLAKHILKLIPNLSNPPNLATLPFPDQTHHSPFLRLQCGAAAFLLAHSSWCRCAVGSPVEEGS